jgi:hypothetical protein
MRRWRNCGLLPGNPGLAVRAPGSVEAFAKRLFLAGLPRNQLLADVFLPRG